MTSLTNTGAELDPEYHEVRKPLFLASEASFVLERYDGGARVLLLVRDAYHHTVAGAPTRLK
jgi:hypothetical protein